MLINIGYIDISVDEIGLHFKHWSTQSNNIGPGILSENGTAKTKLENNIGTFLFCGHCLTLKHFEVIVHKHIKIGNGIIANLYSNKFANFFFICNIQC